MQPVLALLLACSSDDPNDGIGTESPTAETEVVESGTLVPSLPRVPHTVVADVSAQSGVDGVVGGERTRAVVAADFDNDGLDDLFMGNPGDESYVLRNISKVGAVRFERAQTLSRGHLSWTAAAADYDNDGDVDLFVGGGGNECWEVDQLWENQWMQTGELQFIDVRIEAGLTLRDGSPDNRPDSTATTGARWADFDNDGLLDLYTTHNGRPGCAGNGSSFKAVNHLWHNEGGTFVNITQQTGVGIPGSTRHPAVFDYDQDGDLDIYNSNYLDESVMLQNLLKETGILQFADATAGLAERGDSLTRSNESFASCTADLDNDGFEDLVVFQRSAPDCSVASDDEAFGTGVYHSVYRNAGGTHFDDVTERAGLEILPRGARTGVMGCQLGDINGDGAIDAFVGNGGPKVPTENDLYLGRLGQIGFARMPSLPHATPYRTHGSIIADLDGDAAPELLVGNGGRAQDGDEVREPTELFTFDWAEPPTFLTLRLQGDGVHVSRDAIGARVELVLRGPSGTTRSLFRWVTGASCFSAENGRALSFGLADAEPVELRVTWPDGRQDDVPVKAGETSLTLQYP